MIIGVAAAGRREERNRNRNGYRGGQDQAQEGFTQHGMALLNMGLVTVRFQKLRGTSCTVPQLSRSILESSAGRTRREPMILFPQTERTILLSTPETGVRRWEELHWSSRESV